MLLTNIISEEENATLEDTGNLLRPTQNDRCFADDILKLIFFYVNHCIFN